MLKIVPIKPLKSNEVIEMKQTKLKTYEHFKKHRSTSSFSWNDRSC